MYKIPDEYYFRLHHVRPRFKGDVENVLIYIAEGISSLSAKPNKEFAEDMDKIISMYPGNANRTAKTIANWRTEISSLFGFVEHHNDGEDKPGRRAIELAESQDLIQFFKTFLFTFQYPGAHIKKQSILEQIEHGIHFKPAQYILKLFQYACKKEKANIGFTKAEICHCVFNDLRCTRDNEDVSLTWERIKKNRKSEQEYDQTGDVIRYAGDIIDYMEIADLLKTYDHYTYYLNNLEEDSILQFIQSSEWFDKYDTMISNRFGTYEEIDSYYDLWFGYVNRDMKETDFSTDILKFIAQNQDELDELQRSVESNTEAERIISKRIASDMPLRTKDIGDIGESLVYGHECMRLHISGRDDLVHLVKRIPTQFAVGYDVLSVEIDDEKKRFIEVKTTISSKPLDFNKVHMTPNEWNTANSVRDRYYVYRLLISKHDRKLFLLQNPVGLYKNDEINMIPENGATITFNPENVGRFEELLTWQS